MTRPSGFEVPAPHPSVGLPSQFTAHFGGLITATCARSPAEEALPESAHKVAPFSPHLSAGAGPDTACRHPRRARRCDACPSRRRPPCGVGSPGRCAAPCTLAHATRLSQVWITKPSVRMSTCVGLDGVGSSEGREKGRGRRCRKEVERCHEEARARTLPHQHAGRCLWESPSLDVNTLLRDVKTLVRAMKRTKSRVGECSEALQQGVVACWRKTVFDALTPWHLRGLPSDL